MNVLGISCFFHDAAAALISADHGVLAAAEEERFTRRKHDHNFPKHAIDFCLAEANLKPSDVDIVAFYEEPWSKLNRVGYNYLKSLFRSDLNLNSILAGWANQKLWVADYITNHLGIGRERIKFFPHHLSHAYSAFGPSGFSSAACLTLDGVGEWETATFGKFENGKYQKFASHRFPHSLGLMYSAFAEFLGFEVNDGEFKVMGMAAYGSPKYAERIRRLFQYQKGFKFNLDMSYFSFDRSSSTNLTKKFISVFGTPRPRDADFLSADSDVGSFTKSKELVIDSQQYYADIAASLQEVLETVVLELVEELYSFTNQENLVYAGGVALNSVLNGRIVLESSFENVFIQPAAGDNGAAVGAAFCALGSRMHQIRDQVRLKTGSLGKSYGPAEIIEASKRNKYPHFVEYEASAALIEEIVERLMKGQVGAIFRSGFEFGPRALGNRSIIADPRSADMKARVNHAVKFRELFRPFAPIVALEAAPELFEFQPATKAKAQPFAYMMAVTKVKTEHQSTLEAITHVDGTARVQVVHSESDPFLYELLTAFGKPSGVPVLMNTSFNRKGEPIVNSPDEALSTFLWTDIDFLVMESFIFFKEIPSKY